MNLTIERNDLLAALSRVVGIVPRSHATPVVSNVLLTAGDDGLTLRATNMDIEARARCPAIIVAPGSITAPAAQLSQLVRNLAEGADIAVTLDGERLAIRSGRARFKLPTLPAHDFPVFADDDWVSQWAMPAARLADMVARTAWAAVSGKEAAARPMLAGVNLAIAESALRLAGTNGQYIQAITVAAPDGSSDVASATIPSDMAAEIGRLADETGEARVFLSDGKVRVETNAVIITGRLIDYRFIDYARFVQSLGEPPHRLTIGREALRTAMKRVMSVAEERAIILDLAADTVTVSSRSGGNEGAEEVSATADKAMRLGLNPQQLEGVLANLRGDTVTCAYTDAAKPTIWTGAETDVFCVLAGQRVAADNG